MDRRATPVNTRVAHVSLKGRVSAPRYASPTLHHVTTPVTALYAAPNAGAARDRELAFGEGFDVLDTHNRWAFGCATRDGYVGYIAANALSATALLPTHRVIAPTYASSEPRLKSRGESTPLPIGARVPVCAIHHDHCDWAEIDWPATDSDTSGSTLYVPALHLAPLSFAATNPVTEAERYLNTPYLWAGNSGFGIDCSGLIQAALLACNIPCPGDSDQQQTSFPDATGHYEPGDLLFWKGHVAMAVDAQTMIHANAHHMAVAIENIDKALTRIAATDGHLTGHKRPIYEVQS
ncbi:NlpC/P60 family protein [Shimia abyssi]|uniref:Cell wall-associated NlpC family hydrolase n=1 Tax=Shimia abyssi TaxID=1662395 RepID=A0A2P8FKR9_9RHOB|nr:NlpC/P60 family protein [Shimia abyssi]PSL22327.1 cell wall-associated NlpC family hydrolase [Shimia abyssi]